MQTLFDVGIEEMKLVRTVHQLVFVHIKRRWTSKVKAKLVLRPEGYRAICLNIFISRKSLDHLLTDGVMRNSMVG